MASRHPAELRASDADRDRVAQLLRDHYGAGRLTDDELNERLDRVYAARSVGELERLTVDLPEPGTAVQPTPRKSLTRGGRALRTGFRLHFFTFALVNLMLIAVWAASGGGYFWPIWPMIGWGIGVGAHAAPILAGVGTRPYDPALAARSSMRQIAQSVDEERPDLRRATAPDGTVTILFSDIEGSTELNERLGDVRWVELLRVHHKLIREQVAAHQGFEVKEQGDGFMLAFPSARRAIRCAQAIQAAVTEGLGDHPDGPVRVRIGLHTGEAIREESDFYGRTVVMAARIAAHATGGEILASSTVRQLCEGGGDVTFADEREVELEGLGGTHRVFAVS